MSKYLTVTQDDPITEATRQWKAHGWDDAAAGMAAVTTITRANRALVSRIESALAPFDLSFARFEIIRLLGFARDHQLPMGKIGDRLQVHPASVTSAVKRLERDGLITRNTAPHDNRIVLARLSARGEQVLGRATQRMNQIFRTLELDREDLEMVTTRLAQIAAD